MDVKVIRKISEIKKIPYFFHLHGNPLILPFKVQTVLQLKTTVIIYSQTAQHPYP